MSAIPMLSVDIDQSRARRRESEAARAGFTLIEMLLALLIGMFLIVAVYVALDIQVNQSQAGRNGVEGKTLANHLIRYIESDIMNSMGAYDPRGVPDPTVLQTDNTMTAAAGTTGTTGTTATTTATTTTTTASTATVTTNADGSTTSNNLSATPATAFSTSGQGTFNIGVQGDSSMLTLTITRLKRDANNIDGITTPPGVSDLHKVTYWFAGEDVGLCRQEIDVITSAASEDVPPDVGNPMTYQIAGEVTDVEFQYFDGVDWQSEWDGTVLGGADGMTPVGPPAAISIKLSINQKQTPDDTTPDLVITHVVALPAGNNFPTTQAQLAQ